MTTCGARQLKQMAVDADPQHLANDDGAPGRGQRPAEDDTALEVERALGDAGCGHRPAGQLVPAGHVDLADAVRDLKRRHPHVIDLLATRHGDGELVALAERIDGLAALGAKDDAQAGPG